MDWVKENWSIIRWVLGIIALAMTWYFSVSTKVNELEARLDAHEITHHKIELTLDVIEKRLDRKHDLLLEIKFNLRKHMEASGESYTEGGGL